MKPVNPVRRAWLMLILLALVFTRDIHAYLDPGTGSLVFQAVVATLAGAAFALKTYWGKVRLLFGRRDTPSPDDCHDKQT